ncbi:cupin domain-containing protein [Solibacillus sp. FSL K6-1523]|uniref:cupin domain-containing protein n=1 Tax=Solibacillus sp. FSL K6-1523 TaxID=2921471 RepID=UPI0030F6D829
MYYAPYMHQYPQFNYATAPMYNYGMPSFYSPYAYGGGQVWNYEERLTDHGPQPYVVNIEEAIKQNQSYRTALWTGKHLQVTLMNLKPGEDIGLEMHPNVDQFLRVEQGHGIVQMGDHKNHLNFVRDVSDDDAIIIPAGQWHNLTNTGTVPLKLYSIYAPPNHPFGTVHLTKAEAEEEEHHHQRN